MAKIKRQKGHIKDAFTAKHILHVKHFTTSENTICKVHFKLVLRGLDRCVSGKHAPGPYGLYIIAGERPSVCLLRLLIKQFHGEKCGVPLIHVKPLYAVISEGPEHPHTADPEYYFLTEPVIVISSVQQMGNSSIEL